MSKAHKQISLIALVTMGSRILGLSRDILLFAMLGTGTANSAFILAFTLPNLFRRLLGEGALSSSTIPVLSEKLSREGASGADKLLNAILTRLALVLAILQVIGIAFFIGVQYVDGLDPRWYLGADLSKWLFFYMFFVCISALICGALNVREKFALAAMGQVWLNLSMIGGMLLGIYQFKGSHETQVYLLSGFVLLGGFLQLVIPALGLRKLGWHPSVEFEKDESVEKVISLFFPALLGAAIFQINILVSRLFAFSLDENSTGILYLSARLVELPLGVFAISVVTVLFPQMSRAFAKKDEAGFRRTYHNGLEMIAMISLPASAGLIILAEPILQFLFQWGMFDSRDVSLTVPVLQVSALGLPLFAASANITRAYYARQDTRLPVRFAIVALILNVIFCFLFMEPLGATGLALATVLTSLIHVMLLHFGLPFQVRGSVFTKEYAKILLALGALSLTCLVLDGLFDSIQIEIKLKALLQVIFIIPIAILIYTLSLKSMKSRQIVALYSLMPMGKRIR